MARLIVRKGDMGSHGGPIVTGSENTFAEGKQVARIGDTYDCKIHGPNPIVEGSGNTICNGRNVVRHGDHSACGAAMISGATRTYVN